MPDTDVWATWLRSGRDGGSAAMRAENLRRLAIVRDLILDRADIRPGETVLDAGTGQGLLGLDALDRTAPDGRVIFSDISAPLLDDCTDEVERIAASARSSFVCASATDLSAIATAFGRCGGRARGPALHRRSRSCLCRISPRAPRRRAPVTR